MFFTKEHKLRLDALERALKRSDELLFQHDAAINALLKIQVNKVKQKTTAPHGVKKDGTPKAKPGRKKIGGNVI